MNAVSTLQWFYFNVALIDSRFSGQKHDKIYFFDFSWLQDYQY